MTFYFYDLETSGLNARAHRIMQFAGQRTDENFNPIGEPHNWLVKLTDEILPDPDAVLITGITPQKTLEEGYTEAEFLKLLTAEVLQPDTVIVGFNSIRFDDEFMRATFWRNFYDPYEWQWQDGRSRWDMLDVVRMVRALRPEGITWPVDAKGQPTNRLELLTKANGLDHHHAHDALSDVLATISVAKLLKEKQPKIFDFLLSIRDKKKIAGVVSLEDPKPFVYTSGRLSNKWEKTTAAVAVGHGANNSILVYDLRQDPVELAKLSDEELAETLFARNQKTDILPVKQLKPNSCPAVAPLGVLDKSSQEKLGLNQELIQKHYSALFGISGFAERIVQLFGQHDELKRSKYAKETDPDFQIYDGFVGDQDKTKMRIVRAADENSLADTNLDFSDDRLEKLLIRYKARNFPRSITASEREAWENYRTARIIDGANGQLSLAQFAKRLSELASENTTNDNVQFLLQELQLYAESIAPVID
jgi:exodeoxyribonuclease-1